MYVYSYFAKKCYLYVRYTLKKKGSWKNTIRSCVLLHGPVRMSACDPAQRFTSRINAIPRYAFICYARQYENARSIRVGLCIRGKQLLR